jgi:hypothetical protein
MKIKIIKEVYTQNGWRREGDIVTLDPKTTRYYLNKGIAVEHTEKEAIKEAKPVKETKEAKGPRKRATKNVSNKNK